MRTDILPTKFHAFEDYTTAAALPTVARVFGWSPKVRWVLDGVACLTTAQSLLTDYEGGAARVMPMQAHLAADVVIGAGLIGAAVLMDDQPKLARLTMAGTGAYVIALAAFTRPEPADRTTGPSRATGWLARRAVAMVAGR